MGDQPPTNPVNVMLCASIEVDTSCETLQVHLPYKKSTEIVAKVNVMQPCSAADAIAICDSITD